MVTDGAGHPLANIPLLLLDQNGDQQVTTTGDDGSYDFDTLDLDTYAISVGQAPGIDRKQVTLTSSAVVQTENLRSAAQSSPGLSSALPGARPSPAPRSRSSKEAWSW